MAGGRGKRAAAPRFAAPAALAALCAALAGCIGGGDALAFRNDAFYDGGAFSAESVNSGGRFRPEAAAAAYAKVMERLGWDPAPGAPGADRPAPECTDFRTGDFVNTGAGVFGWANEIREEYAARDIVLLPGQATAECRHERSFAKARDIRTGREYSKDLPCKTASWLVRRGWVYAVFSAGEPNIDSDPALKARILAHPPGRGPAGAPFAVHAEKWTADGKARKLPADETWYFFVAGEDGAVISEFSNYRDPAGARCSLPGATF